MSGRVLTTITVRRASDGALVDTGGPFTPYELRTMLPRVHADYPRPDYRIELEARIEP